MRFAEHIQERTSHPVDIVEHLAAINDWTFERSADDEINISVGGGWTDYHVSFTWHDELESLHLSCLFEIRSPSARRAEMYRLVAMINERLWIGHFDLWNEGALIYRHGLLLSGGASPLAEQCEALLRVALESCERYYQAFQLVSWAGRSADDALTATLFETVGEA